MSQENVHHHRLFDLGHDHGTTIQTAHHERRTRWVVILTVWMMVIELVFGRITGSLALTADGWHMATHVGALGMSVIAYWFARTRSSHETFSFGTGKVYALSGYTSAVVLAFVSCWMCFESVSRFFYPKHVDFSDALPVAVIGLVVNLVSAKLLEHNHDEHHDHNIRAAYFHVLADAMTSVFAIVALLGGRYLHWNFLDPLMGIVGGLLIGRWAWGLCRSAACQLLDVSPSVEEAKDLQTHLESIDDVRVADLHIWEMGPGRRGCIVTLTTSLPRESCFYREAILSKLSLAHLTVEVHQCAPTIAKADPAGEPT